MTPLRDAVPTDQQIVAAVLAGQPDAFRVLFERHHGSLVRYLTAQTGDPALAEDLAQDAFLVAFRALPDLADGRPIVPWLYRIAQHRLQRAWRRRRLLRFVSLDHPFGSPGVAASGLRLPGDLATACAERDLIRRVLDGLGEAQRTVLLLHDLKGLTAREIAEVVGVSPAAAERQLSRARARFRDRYNTLAATGE